MKRLIKCMLFVATMIALLETTEVYASQIGDFTFTFVAHVKGKSKFAVEKNYAYCDSLARTYIFDRTYDYNDYLNAGIIHSKIYNYKITMVEGRLLGKGYGGEFHAADGQWNDDEYRNLRNGNYKVNVDTDGDMAPSCAEISGKGILLDTPN